MSARFIDVKFTTFTASNAVNELEELHVKLCWITKLDLGPEMDVVELRNNTCNNEHESKKRYTLVPVDFV